MSLLLFPWVFYPALTFVIPFALLVWVQFALFFQFFGAFGAEIPWLYQCVYRGETHQASAVPLNGAPVGFHVILFTSTWGAASLLTFSVTCCLFQGVVFGFRVFVHFPFPP